MNLENWIKVIAANYVAILLALCSFILLTGCTMPPENNIPKSETEVLVDGLNQALSTYGVFGGWK